MTRSKFTAEQEAAILEAATTVMGRFAQGLGATLDRDGQRIYLVPEGLVQDGGRGLVIAVEGRGAFCYDGTTPLNPFRLVKAGFPMLVAENLSEFINRLVEHISGPSRTAIGHTPSSE